jgi:hypothetical protein
VNVDVFEPYTELTSTDTDLSVVVDACVRHIIDVKDVQELVIHTTPLTNMLGVMLTVAKLNPDTVKLVIPDGTRL